MRPNRKARGSDEAARLDSLVYSRSRYQEMKPGQSFRAATPDEALEWQKQARARLWELIGGLPSDATRVALNPRYGKPVRRPGYTRTPVTFTTRPDLDAFAYFLVPDGLKPLEQRPAILCLPGHGRGVDDIVGMNADGSERDHHDGYQHDFAVQCVERGYVVLALEMLGFGHRRDEAARTEGAGSSSCQPAAGAALLLGETMAGWRTWDASCALDLLQSRPEVDGGKLGLIGISGGGTVGLYTAALDRRVQAAVLSCSFCTYRDSIFSVSHCIDNYVPGMLRSFEMADVAAMIAPRGLFCENGSQDDIFPEAGAREAFQKVQASYTRFSPSDRAVLEVNEGGHQFYGNGAFEALRKWLGDPIQDD